MLKIDEELLIGEGTHKRVYSTDIYEVVLIIHKEHHWDRYYRSRLASTDLNIGEIKVFEVGTNFENFYAKTERFDLVPKEDSDDIGDLLVKLTISCYDAYESRESCNSEVFDKIMRDSDTIDSIKNVCLSYFNFRKLFKEVMYKISTERDGDLTVSNLGFRLIDHSPVFFDW